MTSVGYWIGENTEEFITDATTISDQRWHKLTPEWPRNQTSVWWWFIVVERHRAGIMELQFAIKKTMLSRQRLDTSLLVPFSGDRPSTWDLALPYPISLSRSQWPLKVRIWQQLVGEVRVALKVYHPREEGAKDGKRIRTEG
jgi:hypothetical protein